MTNPKIKQSKGLEEAHKRALQRADAISKAMLMPKEKKVSVNSRLEYLESEVQKLKEKVK